MATIKGSARMLVNKHHMVSEARLLDEEEQRLFALLQQEEESRKAKQQREQAKTKEHRMKMQEQHSHPIIQHYQIQQESTKLLSTQQS